MNKFIITIILLLSLFTLNIAEAHPWRTDSIWCHTCRTNCSDWGLYHWEYHCHWWNTIPIITPKAIDINTGSSYKSLKTELVNLPINYWNEKIESTPMIKYIESCSWEKNEIKKLEIQLSEKNNYIMIFKNNEKELKLINSLYKYLIFILIGWILYLSFRLIRKK